MPTYSAGQFLPILYFVPTLRDSCLRPPCSMGIKRKQPWLFFGPPAFAEPNLTTILFCHKILCLKFEYLGEIETEF